jgi:AT hook motif
MTTNGEGSSSIYQATSSAYETSEPAKKKRGRPTKAETEAKKLAAERRGEPWPPIRPGPKTPRPSVSGSTPIAVMNPTMSPGQSGSPGTPGTEKKKRGRPTKVEVAAKLALEESMKAAGVEESASKVTAVPEKAPEVTVAQGTIAEELKPSAVEEKASERIVGVESAALDEPAQVEKATAAVKEASAAVEGEAVVTESSANTVQTESGI